MKQKYDIDINEELFCYMTGNLANQILIGYENNKRKTNE